MGKEKLKAAVIGMGKMGILHASILNVLSDVELVALCDKSSLIVDFARKALDGCRVINNVEKLSGLDLDVVYVTTPISSHYKIAESLYSRKIVSNLFVEKTLASSYDEAEKLCSLARDFGGVNMVGYMKRFSVTFGKCRKLLEEGALGDLASFDAYAYSSDFLGCKIGSGSGESRGGVLRDLGAHVVDLALWFFGDLKVETARVESVVGGRDAAYFGVEGADGLKGRFNVSWCMEGHRMPEFGLLIRGSRGVLRVDDDKVELKQKDGNLSKWYRHDLDDNVDYLLGASEFFREDEHFIKSAVNGEEVEPDFCCASKVDHLIDQVESRADRDA